MQTIKLICIPYAGGMASLFEKWKKYLHPSIELVPVELAGRGTRASTPFYQSVEEAARDISQILKTTIESSSYAIWGHSVGSLISFELARQWHSMGMHAPEHIFFSGRKGAPLPNENRRTYELSDDDFVEAVLQYNGTPKALFEHKGLAELFLPILRADFKMAETYEYTSSPGILKNDISVLYGTDDVPADHAEAWRSVTSGNCFIYPFKGAHFFINEEIAQISALFISKLINPLVEA